ncbi:tripartite-type tricarboxylate transporter receptor subunit TctC [Sphaerotilus hippei]|uniref:Tripartite-type tricarboxylate transporter receptor subunit TctC n=1 Tax=Sphaerotilus hippei TaxID=744406 RepID=A0A318GYU4_9BURK|nr:tripartite tricarboxylate transporter substrate binding protein [Sphaerotilus hippei]PXW95244.1 tripartite-type tricarboxylate transporter receptor subunit TctC [Sphaerotilus hippei]
MKLKLLLACCGAVLAMITSAPARAAGAYPDKPIQLVIPFPPGGATDVIGRMLGKVLADRLGQSVVIENRAGAGTIVGAGYVAKAAPDGYTLLVSSGTTFTVNPAIQPRLPYDPVRSFEPIGLVGRTGLILLANKDVPARTPREFVDLVKAAPDHYLYGSYGNGTTSHFAAELMLRATGLKMAHVPYKGSAPAMVDLMGGQIPFTVDTVAAALPQLRSGKIKAIALTTARRSRLLPDVPTFAEAGYAVDMDTWLVVAAPRGLPPAVKARLEKALADTIALPKVREDLIASGFEPAWGNGAAASALIDKELPLMRVIAQKANIHVD